MDDLKIKSIYALRRHKRNTNSKWTAQDSYTLLDHSKPRERDAKVGNLLLFHGSRANNYVGLLSRGILLPKLVLSQGLTKRTDFGYLGHGIYFSDNAYASVKYTVPLATAAVASSTTSSAAPKGGKRGRGKRGGDVAGDSAAAATSTITATNDEAAAAEDRRFMLLVNVYCGRMKDYDRITPDLTHPPRGFDCCHGTPSDGTRPSDFTEDEYVIYDVDRQELEYLVEFGV